MTRSRAWLGVFLLAVRGFLRIGLRHAATCYSSLHRLGPEGHLPPRSPMPPLLNPISQSNLSSRGGAERVGNYGHGPCAVYFEYQIAQFEEMVPAAGFEPATY